MVNVNNNIFLIGFMGAGKSTVGNCLARRLGYRFIDLDQLIVDRENKSIVALFAERGESYFRDCESAVLAEQVRAKYTIFATGGGIVGRDENRVLMKRLGRLVYLRATWSTLEKRLSKSCGRPLADPGKGVDAIRALWESRLPWYEEADLIIDTDEFQIDTVTNEIISRLKLAVTK
jgi:shikimate kinase